MEDKQQENPVAVPDPRVILAGERTLLAWIRTGLALMGFGFVVSRFGLFLREIATVRGEVLPPGRTGSLWIGIVLVGLGVWVLIVSGIRYRSYTAALVAGKDVRPPGMLFGLAVVALLAAAGLIMAGYLFTLEAS